MKPCELFSLIPREKLDYLFEHSGASAELDYTFLGFEDVYKDMLNFVPKDKTIIDLGCGYAAQSYYFRENEKYIGVDACGNNDTVIKVNGKTSGLEPGDESEHLIPPFVSEKQEHLF